MKQKEKEKQKQKLIPKKLKQILNKNKAKPIEIRTKVDKTKKVHINKTHSMENISKKIKEQQELNLPIHKKLIIIRWKNQIKGFQKCSFKYNNDISNYINKKVNIQNLLKSMKEKKEEKEKKDNNNKIYISFSKILIAPKFFIFLF